MVGDISSGLPTFRNPFNNGVALKDFLNLLPTSLLISVIAFIESYAVANKYAAMKGQTLDASQELIALGVCNMAPFFLPPPINSHLLTVGSNMAYKTLKMLLWRGGNKKKRVPYSGKLVSNIPNYGRTE